MLYQKKRKKISEHDEHTKNNQDSTLNSDRIKSNQKLSTLSKDKKKHFNKIINKRTFDTNKSQNQSHKQTNPIYTTKSSQDFVQTVNKQPNRDLKISSYQQLQRCKQDEQNQLVLKKSISNSTFSLQLNNIDQNGNNSSRKKFKLYCQLKRKKQNKKPQQQKQIQKNSAYSTGGGQSWMKNSIFSKNSQRNDSNSTSKSKNRFDKLNYTKKKINLEQKIKLIKSKQKNQSQISQRIKQEKKIINENNQDKIIKDNRPQLPNLNLKLIHQDSTAKKSQKSTSKRSKNSQQKKQTTLNIKKSSILQKLNAQKNNSKISSTKITQNILQPKYSSISTNTVSYGKEQQNIKILGQKDMINKQENNKKDIKIIKSNDKKSTVKFDRILPQDSQIIQQSVKKLSQIRQQKNQDTFSRSLKVQQINSIDHSNSKNNQITSLHLSINSVCRDRRRSFNCILLQTTQLKESALRKQIQSSLSQLQKTRQKINIQKFKQPKNIQQIMGSSKLSARQQSMTTIQKIQFHIQIINTLSNFVYKSTQLQYLMQDWDELNFLIYKKFYIQRTKVLNFLKKYPIKNPFCINRASIQTKQILNALKTNQFDIKRIKLTLEKQNVQIKKNLQVFFAQFDKQKQGQKINLFQYDNFSDWIYKQLWDQIQLFFYSQSHNTTQLQDRICKSLQAGFLISQLNGNFVTPFQHAQKASYQNNQKTYIDDNLEMFQKYVLNKKK